MKPIANNMTFDQALAFYRIREAAPDLLEALQMALRNFDDSRDIDGMMRKQMESAIDKAIGN